MNELKEAVSSEKLNPNSRVCIFFSLARLKILSRSLCWWCDVKWRWFVYWLLWCDHAAAACLPSSILLFSPFDLNGLNCSTWKLSIHKWAERNQIILPPNTSFGFACQCIFLWCYENKKIKVKFNDIISFLFGALCFVQFHGIRTIQIKSDYADRVCLSDYVDAAIWCKKIWSRICNGVLYLTCFRPFFSASLLTLLLWVREIFTSLRFHTIYKWHKLNQQWFFCCFVTFSNFVLS